jgi:heat shock protein HslJ
MAAAGCKAALAALACAACTSIAADARTFEGTRWHVTAINGKATPASGNYVIRFDKGRIGGQFGCNHFGGEYRVARDLLSTDALAMTMMACPEPAMTFESQGGAVLQQPMRISWSSARHLTLSNFAGSIALELQR